MFKSVKRIALAVAIVSVVAPLTVGNAAYIGTVKDYTRAATNKNTGADSVKTYYKEISVRNGYTWTSYKYSDDTATEYAVITKYVYTVY